MPQKLKTAKGMKAHQRLEKTNSKKLHVDTIPKKTKKE